MSLAIVGEPQHLMAFTLIAFFRGRNVTACKYTAKNYTASISHQLFLSLTSLGTAEYPLSIITHLSPSLFILNFKTPS